MHLWVSTKELIEDPLFYMSISYLCSKLEYRKLLLCVSCIGKSNLQSKIILPACNFRVGNRSQKKVSFLQSLQNVAVLPV